VRTEPPLSFVPGPVEIPRELRELAGGRLPYARTASFSALIEEVVDGLRMLFGTSGSVVLLTTSGTAAMEATVGALFDHRTPVLVVTGGTFGDLWTRICGALCVPHDVIRLDPGRDLSMDLLAERLARRPYAGVLLNAHETSTGHLYDVEAIGREVCERQALFVVDAISSVGADPFRMDDWGCDAVIASTQKALALPPGMSFVALSPAARERALRAPERSVYLHLARYLRDIARSQTPFTPAIGVMLPLRRRLADIRAVGLEAFAREHRIRAEHFRTALRWLPVRLVPDRPSNALSAFTVVGDRPRGPRLVELVREAFWMQLAPNAAALSEIIRVSHMGEQGLHDLDALAAALRAVWEGKEDP